jgi:CDP-glucose 4,6-dehydratase
LENLGKAGNEKGSFIEHEEKGNGSMSFWKEKHVFITGATGLVGSWLVKRLLREEAYVVALIRDWDPQSELVRSGQMDKISVIQGRLEDGHSIRRALVQHEIDTVIHLGAQTIVGAALKDPLETFESNIRGTYLLLEACRQCRENILRIVVASSDKAYGTSSLLPYTENMPLRGLHPYDVSKSCTDLLSLSYFHTYRLPIVVGRCGNIFGGGDLNWSRIVPGTIQSFYHAVAPLIRSDGTLTRDYLFVEDAVDAYLKMAERMEEKGVKGDAFNFGPNRPYSVLEIVAMIQKLMNVPHLQPKILAIAKAEIAHQFLSSEKAKNLLGWEPHFSIEEGLNQTIEWYENYFSHTKKMERSCSCLS